MTDPIHIRPFKKGDEEGVVACYNAVFPAANGLSERSLEHWRWKFQQNPAKRMLHIVAEHESDGIVGLYAGIPLRIWSEQREQLAAQGVDFVVLPRWRRYGKGAGLFVDLGRAYIDTWHGDQDGDVLFTYGWPVPAWKAGQKHLGYLNIRDWDCTFRETRTLRPRAEPAGLTTSVVTRFATDVDQLFGQLKPTLELAIIRDQAYLNWRYADRPERYYHLLECRETATGALRGIAVYGWGSPSFPGGYLCDWLQHADDEDTMVSMVAALERLALRDGVEVIGSFWNHMDPRFLAMQDLGYRVKGSEYFVVLATAKHDTRYFRDHWYLTLGDSDLI